MSIVSKIKELKQNFYRFQKIHYNLRASLAIQRDQQIQQLLSQERYNRSQRLNSYEFQVYSQTGEDGLINKIFNLIGTDNKYFLEIGSGNGLQNNTAFLLTKGWQGTWIDADQNNIKTINSKFKEQLQSQELKCIQSIVNQENISQILMENKIPNNLDLISIDIDGNDYWLWKALNYQPRLVVIEYNPLYPPPTKWVMTYNPKHYWHGDTYYGASLESLCNLAESKGYELIACSLSGINAFFVRKDLLSNHFPWPHTAEYLYEPARYYLAQTADLTNHRRSFGSFVND